MIRKALTLYMASAISTATPVASAAPPQATPPPQLEAGDRVPSFETLGVDGSAQRLDFPEGRTTVLLFFLSSCGTCHRMIPIWNEAYPRRGEGVDVIGVIVDREPATFFEIMPVAFPVVRSPGKQLLESYKVHKVPMTIRILPGGVVEDVGQGMLDPIRLGEMFY
jgi:peroxiredoxin